jgi:GH25 family lysozyme M1 (1,4-beta-N-acetylmuramidase)
MINGIDVASYQPAVYPTSGLDYVFVKATEGTTYVNPLMGRQAATARTAGLPLGFYHFLTGGKIKEQAAYFVDQAASVQGDMLVCDWETPPLKGIRAATCGEKDLFLAEVRRLRPGHKVGLYCNVDYWKHRDVTSYCADFLWIADPNRHAGDPGIAHAWRFHQYAVKGGYDRNVSNFTSRAALREWCGYPVAPKPKPTTPAPAPAKPTTYDKGQDARLAKIEAELDAI